MRRKPPLPTFLIIGAQKSATRWLRHNLGLHPEIYVVPVELDFFNNMARFKRGVRWYRAQFAGRALRDARPGQTPKRRQRVWWPVHVSRRDRKLGWSGQPIVGEATPGYMMWRHNAGAVANRIKRTLPDVRLIAVLRNPVDRANSAMVRHIRQKRLPPDARLLELVKARPPEAERFHLIAGGWYAVSLKPYKRLFGDQLLVLLHDDIRQDPRGAYETALRHIGADPDFAPPELEQVVFSNQEGASPRWRSEISPEDRWELYQYFRDDIRALGRMIGRDLSIWKPPRPIPGWREPTATELAACFRVASDWAEEIVRNIPSGAEGGSVARANGAIEQGLNQLIAGAHLFAALLTRSDWQTGTGDQCPDLVRDDTVRQYREAATVLQSALDEPTNLEGVVATPFRRALIPASQLAGQAVTNHIVTAWELAGATGQRRPIPPNVLEVTSGFAHQLADALAAQGSDVPVARFVASLDEGI